MLHILANLPRKQKKLVLMVFDLLILSAILWASFYIRLGTPFSSNFTDNLYILVNVPPLCILVFYVFGLYNKVIRFITPKFLLATAKAMTAGCAIFLGLVVLFRAETIPRSVYFMYWALGLSAVGGIRLFAREILPIPNLPMNSKKIKVGIYGAGAAGTQLARALITSKEYEPMFFVDDKSDLWNWELSGLKIFNPAKLTHLIEVHEVEEIIFSIPSLPRSSQQRILNSLANLPVKIRTLPSIVELVDGRITIEKIKTVQIEDLLGRRPVDPIPDLIQANTKNKNVMVTGAGGSIGSELCRQILKQSPRLLVLFEMSEYALFRINSELTRTFPNIKIVAVLGTVTDYDHVLATIQDYEIKTIYHSAAYKHVSMVENNVVSGVRNNIFGTKAVVEAAEQAEVETFILISTDKAVRPTSVMGATKRIAELILQAKAQKENQKTIFTMVRFGNVLGSSGSVVPIFREQIKKGGPVTVTDPRMTRYFMTIPEAAQLVIQAGAMAKGGEVFLLDMGDPVNIMDLAKKMIHLSGFSVKSEENPDGDIEIHISGIKPGEKLFEELLINHTDKHSTHPRINFASEESFPEDILAVNLNELKLTMGKEKSNETGTLVMNFAQGKIQQHNLQN